MADRNFHTPGVVPIAVGSAIEVSIFALQTNVFGAPKYEPQPYAPLLRDLQTGVVYGRTWHFADDNSDKVLDSLPFAERPGLRVVERVRGRVRATRVVHGRLPGMGTSAWVTTIVVAEEGVPGR